MMSVRHAGLMRAAAPRAAAAPHSRATPQLQQRSGFLGKSFVARAPVLARGPSRAHTCIVRADYYSALGVGKSATKREIKSAYRKAARQYHPDVNSDPGAEDKFKEVSEAYEVLSDDEKRNIYDQFGEAGLKGGLGGGAAGFSNPFDIFEEIFGKGMAGGMGGGMGGMGGMGFGGGMGGRSQAQSGADEQIETTISFEEAIFGCQKDVDVYRLASCETCEGSGVRPGSKRTSCNQCKGQGVVWQVIQTPLGTFQQTKTCSECSGTGESFTPCASCGGDGRVRASKRIKLNIPAGVENSTRLRVVDEGNAGRRGGPPGDLYVYVNVRAHPELRREGQTVYSDVSVSYLDAILGCTVKVTTVDGTVDLRVPAGTQPGTTLVLGKRGAPPPANPGASRGDHLVKVKVTIPKKIKDEERVLIEKLKGMHSDQKFHIGPFSL